DSGQIDHALLAGKAGATSAYPFDHATQRPGHQITRVQTDCFLPVQPFDWLPSHIQPQNSCLASIYRIHISTTSGGSEACLVRRGTQYETPRYGWPSGVLNVGDRGFCECHEAIETSYGVRTDRDGSGNNECAWLAANAPAHPPLVYLNT